jgi:DNA-binding PadR family transcriptional regulator
MPLARELRGSRRDLAVVLSDDWRTAHEAAKMLGRPTGSIFGVLRRMHSDGLIRADSDPDPPTRGTQYRLTDAGLEVLRDSLAQEVQVGHMAGGRRLLHIERRKSLQAASAVLADAATAGLVDWGAELSDGWLLALVEDADPHRVHMLHVAFERAGCRCRPSAVDAVIPGTLLRERARSLSNAAT